MSLLELIPLREPRANQISTSIFFYSPKLNRQVWCESNLEWDTAILLDHARSVLEYCEQSIELQWSKSTWVPDFVAIVEQDGQYSIIIIEVKYKNLDGIAVCDHNTAENVLAVKRAGGKEGVFVLAGILIFGGGQISSLGIKMVKG